MKGWLRFLAPTLLGLSVLAGAAPAHATAFSDFNSGIAARNSGQCDQAITYFSSALAAPDLLATLRPVAYFGRGTCYERVRRFSNALSDFDSAIGLDPDYYDAHLERGKCLAFLRRYEQAELDFKELIRIRSDLSSGYAVLGTLYDAEKKYDAAIAQYSALIRMGTDDYLAYSMRTRTDVAKGDLDAALADADKVVTLRPESAIVHSLRAMVYAERHNYSAALGDIDDALRIDPTDKDEVREKGVLLWKMNRFADASSTLAGLDPSDGYNVLWLSLARAAGGVADTDLAQRATRVNLKQWPGPLVSLYLGQSSPEAVQQAVEADGPDNRERDECEAPFYMAEWQLQQRNREAARVLLQRAVAVCPSDYIERDAAAVELRRLR